MKIRKKITLESCVKWFAALCTASLLVASVPFTFFLYQLLLMLSVFFGAGLLLWLFLVDRRVYRRPFFPIFLLFCVSYFVTILLNWQSGFFSNCGQLVYTGIYFFVFFCAFSSFGSEVRSATLKLICRMVFIFSMAVALISLGMMLASYSAEVPYRGTTILIGFNPRNTSMQLSYVSSALFRHGTYLGERKSAVWDRALSAVRSICSPSAPRTHTRRSFPCSRSRCCFRSAAA